MNEKLNFIERRGIRKWVSIEDMEEERADRDKTEVVEANEAEQEQNAEDEEEVEQEQNAKYEEKVEGGTGGETK